MKVTELKQQNRESAIREEQLKKEIKKLQLQNEQLQMKANEDACSLEAMRNCILNLHTNLRELGQIVINQNEEDMMKKVSISNRDHPNLASIIHKLINPELDIEQHFQKTGRNITSENKRSILP